MNKNSLITNQPRQLLKYRHWLIGFALLLGLPILFYYGYCWGLWGRGSLLLQYLFQCGCPVVSNEARYPDQVDVLVSACRHTSSRLSPSGRFLYVRDESFGVTSAFLLDLQTRQRIEITDQPFSSFLTDDLLFIESGREDYIMDRKTEEQYPIQNFRNWRGNAYVNGTPNLELLVSALQQADQVFLTPNYSTVVVLMSNQNFTFSLFDFPEWGSNRVEQFLQENNITYQAILADYLSELISPNGRLIARPDGIYSIETGRKIVEGYSLSVRGWTDDGRGVIYSHALGRCLIRITFPFADDPACFFRVPQPVLLLKVPEEYLP